MRFQIGDMVVLKSISEFAAILPLVGTTGIVMELSQGGAYVLVQWERYSDIVGVGGASDRWYVHSCDIEVVN